MPADLSRKPRPDISSSTRTDALDLAMMAHQEGERRGRATLLASLIEKVEAERPVLTTASTVVDAAYHEAYCRVLTLLRTEAKNG